MILRLSAPLRLSDEAKIPLISTPYILILQDGFAIKLTGKPNPNAIRKPILKNQAREWHWLRHLTPSETKKSPVGSVAFHPKIIKKHVLVNWWLYHENARTPSNFFALRPLWLPEGVRREAKRRTALPYPHRCGRCGCRLIVTVGRSSVVSRPVSLNAWIRLAGS